MLFCKVSNHNVDHIVRSFDAGLENGVVSAVFIQTY